MSDFNALPSFLREQVQLDGWVELHPDALWADGCPFVLRLTEIEFEEDRVLLGGSLYCRTWCDNGEIAAFGESKPEGKGTLWNGLSVRFRTWYPKSRFTAENLKFFNSLVGYWAGLDRKINLASDCPWYAAGSVPVKFQLVWEGLWRAKNLDWGNGSFSGRGTRLASDEASPAPAPRQQRFAFLPCSKAGAMPQQEIASPAGRDAALDDL